MWYSESINNNDGIESILSLFKTEMEFINHYFSKILFFSIENVNQQSENLIRKIKNEEKIPVRFSEKSKKHFHYFDEKDLIKSRKKTFKNKKEAIKFSSNNDLFHTKSKIKIKIDKDGNYSVRKEIRNYTGYRVSEGAISDYKNYTISHIWSNTSNPYFFTSLWNISLIPQAFSFILDKSKSSSAFVKKIKIITEIIHLELYQLNSLLSKVEISEKNNFEKDYKSFREEYSIAKTLINKGLIRFLEPKKIENTNLDISDISTEFKQEMNNKDFIFIFLEKLKEIGFEDFDRFTNREYTKYICKLSYPILVDVTGDSDAIVQEKSRPVNSDVYYKKPFFRWNNKKFIVCNDWKLNHRKQLVFWLNDK